MAETTFKCWNCKQTKENSELASIPFVLKVGLTVIMFPILR